MKLDQLRDSLTTENLVLLGSIVRRRNLVGQIQQHKQKNNLPAFDLVQEWKIFDHLKPELVKLTLEELLAYSLIIESQVANPQEYPSWGQGKHLTSSANMIFEKINPILLAQVRPDLIADLQFGPAFAHVKTFIETKLAGK